MTFPNVYSVHCHEPRFSLLTGRKRIGKVWASDKMAYNSSNSFHANEARLCTYTPSNLQSKVEASFSKHTKGGTTYE